MPQEDFVQAPAYAGHFSEYLGVLRRLLDHDPARYALPREGLLVEIGCGNGDMLALLAKRGHARLVGVEPDPALREAARRLGLDIREGTLCATGLPDAFADAVMVHQVFHHVADYEAACAELARVLKPGGLLCFTEPLGTLLRHGMDLLTFHTPLPRLVPIVAMRHRVMSLEMETGLYPGFLREQAAFRAALERRFKRIWHRRGWFFQFGKYRKGI